MQKRTTEQLLELTETYDLPESGRQYLFQTLNSEPAREVGIHAQKNVTGAYSSPSQGMTLQFESHTSELHWLLKWEMDESVFGCRDQPTTIEFQKPDKNGVLRRTRYTPDYLLWMEDEALVVEVKPLRELKKLSENLPEQWIFDEHGWRFLPADAYFRKQGLSHVIRATEEMPHIETNNLKTLIQFRRSPHKISTSSRRQILTMLDEYSCLSLRKLIESHDSVQLEDILSLIVEQSIYVDIQRQIVTDIQSCYASRSKELLAASFQYLDECDTTELEIRIDRVPNAKNMEQALVRFDRAQSECQERHSRRLRSRMKKLKAEGMTSLQALVMPRRGNTTSKIPEVVKSYLTAHVQEHYMSSDSPSENASWTHYRNCAMKKHPEYAPVVIKTYRKYMRMQSPEAVARSRNGKRAGNSAASATSVVNRHIRATRPFERGSFDHTLLKIMVKVVESNGDCYSRKPWLTVLIDDYSGYWLTFFLSFKAPSKRSLAMTFRNCIREHGRLPESLHSDRGSDFRSKYYRSLLANYEITASWSPAGNSRFNSQVEIINKRIKDQWLSRRPGNTTDYKNSRKVSKGHRPQDLVVMDLKDLFEELEAYRHSYNSTVIGNEFSNPQEIFLDGMELFGFSGIPVENNEEFLLTTAYDTDHSTYKIGPNHDVMFNGLHFCHPDLRRLTPKRSSTELRIDPENPYKVYCCVEGKWVTAYQSKHTTFATKGQIVRWSESLSVGEGRSLRDKAKQDGHDIRAGVIEKFDKAYIERNDDVSNSYEFELAEPDAFEASTGTDLLDALVKRTSPDTDDSES